jgi:hypothetical protein
MIVRIKKCPYCGRVITVKVDLQPALKELREMGWKLIPPRK